MNNKVEGMNRRPRLGIALGSGGGKGFAHIGVLKALEEAGVSPDVVTGSSAGAIVGMCHCLGIPLEDVEKRASELSMRKLLDFSLPDAYGFVKGDRAEKIISLFVGAMEKRPTFASCKKPFGCVAVDLNSAKVVNLTHGDLVKSVRASFSINGIFKPVKIKQANLTDGGMLCRVPVDLARELGADIVFAVDCVGPTQNVVIENNKYVDTIARIFSVMDYEVSKQEISRADFLLSIDQPDVSIANVEKSQDSIEYGYRQMKERMPEFIKFLKNKGWL